MPTPPPLAVIEAFTGSQTTKYGFLPGGQGTSWRAGNVVLKPVPGSVAQTECRWCFELLSRIASEPETQSEFRIPRPISSTQHSSTWIAYGWCGQEFVEGHLMTANRSAIRKDNWQAAFRASRSFHAELKKACDGPPPFFEERTHKWARADRLIWSDDPILTEPEMEGLIARLNNLKGHLANETLGTAQLIHGDVAGNVILSQNDKPPAIIDFSPYWRPVAFADAMTVIDALLWYTSDEDLLFEAFIGLEVAKAEWLQLVVRALLFRAVCLDDYFRQRREGNTDEQFSNMIEAELENFERVAKNVEKSVVDSMVNK